MNRWAAALALGAALAACADADTTATSPPTPTTATSTTIPPTTPSAPESPDILAVVTGRGDDGSLEIGVWFDDDPLATGNMLVVGIDSDDSYPGAGDIRAHLDGSALFTAGASGVEVTLVSEGEVVAAPGIGLVESWLSWAAQDVVLRLFFVEDLTTRSGSVWVIATRGDTGSPLGTAGVPLGESCSYRGAGVPVDEPAGGVPDAPRTCRYPG